MVSSEGIVRQDVFIREEKIVQLGLDDGSAKGTHRIDATGKYILPGLVDAHCHLDSFTQEQLDSLPHGIIPCTAGYSPNSNIKTAEIAKKLATSAALMRSPRIARYIKVLSA